jgi:DNA polymerase I-like protein with 3'-5' exonuclease and polymerase domains
MPLIKADAKALEWVACAHLSQDPVAIREINEGVDQHRENQKAFSLGEGEAGRLVAKVFVFRLIYGGSAYAYANDAEFTHVSTKEAFWQGVIDKFYRKYEGIYLWHNSLMTEAMTTGKVVIPTGREFRFKPEYGKWPRTQILNYPVQGFGAELMVIARLAVCHAMKKLPMVLPIATVHDDLRFDSPSRDVPAATEIIRGEWTKIPRYYTKIYGKPFDLPMRVEIKVGPNMKDMVEV